MPLHPEFPIPERILVFGEAGSGKSTNWLNIAKYLKITKSPGVVYAGDSDAAVPRMIASEKYRDIADKVKLYPLYQWQDYMKFHTDVMRFAGPTDWVVIDFISSAWEAVQAYFTEEVFNKDIGNYFLQARKEMEKSGRNALNALEGWTDWSVINPLYRNWINPILYRSRFHVYATAPAVALSNEKKPVEDAATRQLFIRFGVRPEGQKKLPFQFHTLLLAGFTPRTGHRTITTVKDRERQEHSGLVISNFALDYLKGTAGWLMA